MADENISRQVAYCFIDTDVLVHFATFDEVDWPAIVGADQVQLVLAPSVMRELNKHKDYSANAWRQKRARTLVSKLRRLLKDASPDRAATVRAGVFIHDVLAEPSVDWRELGLDRQLNDDRLLATVKEFRDHHKSQRVLLVSNDFLLQRKAQRHSMEVIDPADHIGRVERPAPDKRLQKQLEALRSRYTDLGFGFWENEEPCGLIERSGEAPRAGAAPSDSYIADEIAGRRKRLERMLSECPRRDASELGRFRWEYEDYLRNLDAALRMKRSRSFGPQCELTFVLENVGSAPALDVEVLVQFPEESFVVAESEQFSDYVGTVIVPSEPRPPWRPTSLFKTVPRWSLVDPALLPRRESLEPEGPLYEDWDRSIVRFRHPKLRHQETWILPSLIVYLPPQVTRGFQVLYCVHADNLAKPIRGHVNVVLSCSPPSS